MTQAKTAGGTATLPMHRAMSGAIWAGVGLLVLGTALRGPLVALVATAVLLIPVVANRVPEYVLALGVAATLAGHEFSYLASVGGVILVVGAFTSAFSLALASTGMQVKVHWKRLVLPAMILLWLALRVFLEHDFNIVGAIVPCLSVMVLVLHCLQRRRDVVGGLAAGGFAFVATSACFGVQNASDTRFEGVSGNPNRMVFGLLMFLPFLLSLLSRSRPLGVRALAAVASATSVVLVALSGSAQGVAGLAVILVVLVACLAVGLPRDLRAVTVLSALIGLGVALMSAFRALESSEDLRTLSGRTPIFAAAVRQILRNPFVGSGRQHFSEGAVVDLSAHSVVLALGATAGIPLALSWVVVLGLLLVATIRLIRARNPLAAAPAVLVVSQVVQTVQLTPITWAMVALFLLAPDGSGFSGRPRPRSSSPEPLEADPVAQPSLTGSSTAARRVT